MLAIVLYVVLAIWVAPVALFALYALYASVRREAEPLAPMTAPGQTPPGAT